jgi:histidinol-phosphate phosphatase family protein
MHKEFDTLFLDRDGVINHQITEGYVRSTQEFEFISGVFTAISKLNDIFQRIIIVTNQQCVGKGIITHEQLQKIHDFMLYVIEKKGGKIAAVYYCPHLVYDKCICRKPSTGMFIKASDDFPTIQLKKSFMVGDSDSDIEAGQKYNLKTVKLHGQYSLLDWANDIVSAVS